MLTNNNKYSLLNRSLHWLMSVLLLSNIAIASGMIKMTDSSDKWQMYALHKSMGMLLLFLVIIRFISKIASAKPVDVEIKKWEKQLTNVVHYALYATMFLIPLSGYLMSSCGGYPISMFGISIPSIVSKNAQLASFYHSSHGALVSIMLLCFALHIIGFIKHLIVDKKNLISRMM